MEPALFVRFLAALLLAVPLVGAQQPTVEIRQRPAPSWVTACEDWDEWDKPGPPFKIYGDTYYVGTCGIAAILIASDDGHVLIDSGTEAGAKVVLANIRALGFDPADIKLLLNSHEHFDHVGGLISIQEVTRAPIVTSFEGMAVIASGEVGNDDPQYGTLEPMRSLPQSSYTIDPSPILPYRYAQAQFLLDRFGMWPIPTPGHTAGAMSWMWRACEGNECHLVVYADSLSAVSREDYRFVDNPHYLRQFFASLQRIADADCNILLTPHPSAGNLRGKLRSGDLVTPLGTSCDQYMLMQRAKLIERLNREDPQWVAQNLPKAGQ